MGAAVAGDLGDGTSRAPRRPPAVRISLLLPDRTRVGIPRHRVGLYGGQVPERRRDGLGGDPGLSDCPPTRVAEGLGDRRPRLDLHVGPLLRAAPLARGARISHVPVVRVRLDPCARGRQQTLDRRRRRARSRLGRGAPGARRGRGGACAGDRVALVVRAARPEASQELEHVRQGLRRRGGDRRAVPPEQARQRSRLRVVGRDEVLQGPHVAPRARSRIRADDRPRRAAGDRGSGVALAARAASRSTLACVRRLPRRVDRDLRPVHRGEGRLPLDRLRHLRRGAQPDLPRAALDRRHGRLLLGTATVAARGPRDQRARRLAHPPLRLSALVPVLRSAGLRDHPVRKPGLLLEPACDQARPRRRVRRLRRRCAPARSPGGSTGCDPSCSRSQRSQR